MMRVFLSMILLGSLGGFLKADDEPTYSKDVQPFLKKYCYECHSGEKPKKGIAVDSYENLTKKGKGKLVTPKDVEKSRLISIMASEGKKHMPPKDSDQPEKDEIKMIKAWIKAGAKDDSEGDKKDDKKKDEDKKDGEMKDDKKKDDKKRDDKKRDD